MWRRRGHHGRRPRADVKSIVLRPQIRVHQRPIRLGQRGRARRGHLLEFAPQVLDFVWMIARDLVPEGSLDFFGRGCG